MSDYEFIERHKENVTQTLIFDLRQEIASLNEQLKREQDCVDLAIELARSGEKLRGIIILDLKKHKQ